MVQIIRLSRGSPSPDGQKIASADAISLSTEEQSVAEIISTGSDAIPWVGSLQVCLANLETVASSLVSPSRERLREEVRLLSAKLATAEGELNQNLRDLSVLRLGVKSNLVHESCRPVLSREKVADNGAAKSGAQRESTIRSGKNNLRNLQECTGTQS